MGCDSNDCDTGVFETYGKTTVSDEAICIAEMVIAEYKRLSSEGFTHYHKGSMGVIVQHEVDRLLARRALEEAKWWHEMTAAHPGHVCTETSKANSAECARVANLEQAAERERT